MCFCFYLFGVSICLGLSVLSFKSSASTPLDFRGSLNVSSPVKKCISSWKIGIGLVEPNIKRKGGNKRGTQKIIGKVLFFLM